MPKQMYYEWYEQRYQTVYAAGGECWGHQPTNSGLTKILTAWVDQHGLRGKRIADFACGEGGAGVILSQLGCLYEGYDIAPTAVAKARSLLKDFPQARVTVLNIVETALPDPVDAALDIMGFHMLVTDHDRERYLANVFAALPAGAPVLFYLEAYRADAYPEPVDSAEQWIAMNKIDCVTPQKRLVRAGDSEIEVMVPLLPCRPRNEEQYRAEFVRSGFIVDSFQINGESPEIQYSANIYAHKP